MQEGCGGFRLHAAQFIPRTRRAFDVNTVKIREMMIDGRWVGTR
jgi:hypothetical protein